MHAQQSLLPEEVIPEDDEQPIDSVVPDDVPENDKEKEV